MITVNNKFPYVAYNATIREIYYADVNPNTSAISRSQFDDIMPFYSIAIDRSGRIDDKVFTRYTYPLDFSLNSSGSSFSEGWIFRSPAASKGGRAVKNLHLINYTTAWSSGYTYSGFWQRRLYTLNCRPDKEAKLGRQIADFNGLLAITIPVFTLAAPAPSDITIKDLDLVDPSVKLMASALGRVQFIKIVLEVRDVTGWALQWIPFYYDHTQTCFVIAPDVGVNDSGWSTSPGQPIDGFFILVSQPYLQDPPIQLGYRLTSIADNQAMSVFLESILR
jgi:hypothetical protein